MSILIGLALTGLTLYTSVLSFALRQYSRSRLAEMLSDGRGTEWLSWLDRRESELALTSSFARLIAILATMGWGYSLFLMTPATVPTIGDFISASVLNLALLVVFAIGVPHAIAIYAGETALARALPLLWLMRIVLYPMERVLIGIDFVVRRLLGRTEATREEESERVEQEILDAISVGEAQGTVDETQTEMIRSVLELHDTTVAEIMTPRTDIVAIPADADGPAVRDLVVQAGHSRVPVFERSLDHIIGVLYAKDLLDKTLDKNFRARDVMRPAVYVPEAKSIHQLLRELRLARVHIAIVLDEYGGTAGLVSFEDILEELIGEIDDEYDTSEPPAIQRLDTDTLEVDGRVHIHEVNAELDLELPDDGDYETIAGFVFATLGRIPVAGEEFTHENLHVRVTAAEPRKINRLRLRVLRPAASE